jgi:hypothetical protein
LSTSQRSGNGLMLLLIHGIGSMLAQKGARVDALRQVNRTGNLGGSLV